MAEKFNRGAAGITGRDTMLSSGLESEVSSRQGSLLYVNGSGVFGG